MTSPGASDEGGLVAEEGVDQGSADSTAEAASEQVADSSDLLGEPPRGAPVDEAQAAGPDDMETPESRAARDDRGPGQQLTEGEG